MPSWNTLISKAEHQWKVPDKIVLDLCDELKAGSRVLDLGCGAGRHTVLLAKRGFKTFATDYSQNAIELSNYWIKQEKLTAEFKLSNFTQIPYASHFFDAVISTNVINHAVFDDVKKAVSEVCRVLKKGGLFYFLVISDLDFRFGVGKKIESSSSPRTYVFDRGPEQGVIHHFFNEEDFEFLSKNFDYKLKLATSPADSPEQKDSVASGFEDILKTKSNPVKAQWEVKAVKKSEWSSSV